MNAHHTVKRVADQQPTFADLEAISPLSKTRLKQAISLFALEGF